MGGSSSKVDARSVFAQHGYQLEKKIEDGQQDHNVYLVSSEKLSERQKARIAEYKLKDKHHKQRKNWLPLNHPNVLKLLKHFDHKKRAYFVYENCATNPVSRQFGDCHGVGVPHEASVPPGRAREPLAKRWTFQTLGALKYCNEIGLYHHDFSFDDVWVDEKKEAKIANFDRMYWGAHRRVKTDRTSVNHRSPEGLTKSPCQCVCKRQQSSEKAQVWAVGASLLVLLTGSSIVGRDFLLQDNVTGTKKRKALIKSNVVNLLEFLRKIDLSEECRSFLTQALAFDPEDRPTVEEALKHPWFVDVDLRPPTVGSSTYDAQKMPAIGQQNSPISCTALMVSRVSSDGSEGIIHGLTSAYFTPWDGVKQDSSTGTFHSFSSQDELVCGEPMVKTDPIKVTESEMREYLIRGPDYGLRRIEQPDPVDDPIESYIRTELDIRLDDPPIPFSSSSSSSENRNKLCDMEMMLGSSLDGMTDKNNTDNITMIESVAATTATISRISKRVAVENEEWPTEGRLSENALETISLISDTGQGASRKREMLSDGGKDSDEVDEEDIVAEFYSEARERENLLDDQTPYPNYGRFVPSLTTIPEGKELEVYERRRTSQSGEANSNFVLRLSNKIAIFLLIIILIAVIIYEIYMRFHNKRSPS